MNTLKTAGILASLAIVAAAQVAMACGPYRPISETEHAYWAVSRYYNALERGEKSSALRVSDWMMKEHGTAPHETWIVDGRVKGQEARFEAVVDYRDGWQYVEDITLRKQEGRWVVTNVHSSPSYYVSPQWWKRLEQRFWDRLTSRDANL